MQCSLSELFILFKVACKQVAPAGGAVKELKRVKWWMGSGVKAPFSRLPSPSFSFAFLTHPHYLSPHLFDCFDVSVFKKSRFRCSH